MSLQFMIEIHSFAIFVFLSSWVFLSSFPKIQFKYVFMQLIIEISYLSMYKYYKHLKHKKKNENYSHYDGIPQELVDNNGGHCGFWIKLQWRSKQTSSL